MSHKLRKTLVCMLLIVTIGILNISPAFASDIYYTGAWYNLGTFSFTDYTISSTKTVMGRYLTVRLDFHKPDWDAGLGNINLTFEIRVPGTTNVIAGPYVLGPAGSTSVGQTFYYIDLGYSGRNVEFFFDASSAGPSNGYYRSATIDVFKLYTSN